MNRGGQAGEQLMIFPFLFLLIIIGVGIVGGVVIFFGAEYDVRQIDADILNYKIRECISEGEVDLTHQPAPKEEEFYKNCRISESAIVENNLIFKICLGDGDCVQDDGIIGVWSNLETCRFEGVKENDAFPKCSKSEVEKDGKSYKIITGSNQFSKKRGVGI